MTFERSAGLHHLAELYRRSLRGQAVDLVPDEWLHVTMQSVAIVDEVSKDDIGCIADCAAIGASRLAPFQVRVSRVVVHPEAVVALLTPPEPFHRLRSHVRKAIADVWGAGAVLDTEQTPGDPESFVPHITFAYSRSDGPADALIDAIRGIACPPVTIVVDAVVLLAVDRVERAYRWTPLAVVPLAGTPSS